MKWFKDIFIPSFEVGKEIIITEKQFRIFERYLSNRKESGYLLTIYDDIDKMRIEASEWACVGKYRYYLTIKERG